MRLEHWFYTLPLRLRSLFRRRHVEQELDDELQYHMARSIEASIAGGLKPEDARYAALRAMDGLEQRKEECRDMRRTNWLENLIQDLRFGVRILAKTRGFTFAVVLTLALGIGANTAIFSVVNAVLLRPLPYPDPDRLVQLMISSPEWAPGKNVSPISEPEFIIWRGEKRAFQQVAAYDYGTGVNLTGVAEPEQLKALHVSADYFRLFGAPVEMGRTFSAEEDCPGGPKLAVISNGLWHRRFGGDRSLIGKALILGGEPTVVIGVLSAAFAPDPPAEIWLPLQVDPSSTSPAVNLHAAARLQPGVTLEMAKAQMKPDNERFVHDFKVRSLHGLVGGFTAEPLRDYVVGDVQVALLVAAGAVGFVLLIACANVANLLLARSIGRTRELAIRAALGGTRLRLVVQLLIESVLLAFAGGMLGIPLGYLGLRALMAMTPGEIPRIGLYGPAIALDWHVLAFALLVSVCTGVIVGLLPALTAAENEISTTLNENSTRTGASVRQIKSRSALVIAEMALTLVLLAGAVLLIRSLSALAAVNPGFDAHNVLTFRMSLNESRFHTTAAVADLITDAERRVESLPGVIALAATWKIPLEEQMGGPFVVESRPDHSYGADLSLVSPHYFEVFRIPLRRGRPLTNRDDSRSPSIVLINETLDRGSNLLSSTAPVLWRNSNSLGERITIGKDMGPIFEDHTRQIVGVVGGVRAMALGREPVAMLYVPIGQATEEMTGLLNRNLRLIWAVRTKTDPSAFRAAVERELRTASGGLPVAEIRTMTQVMVESTARERFNTTLLGVFAGLALLLAAVGIYAVMAYAVQLRTKEIGIRMALGAGPRDVSWMVVIEGMTLALLGVGLGVSATLALTPLMKSLLYGVAPSDPGVIALVAVILSAVAMLATYIPARRATLIDPILTLRWE